MFPLSFSLLKSALCVSTSNKPQPLCEGATETKHWPNISCIDWRLLLAASWRTPSACFVWFKNGWHSTWTFTGLRTSSICLDLKFEIPMDLTRPGVTSFSMASKVPKERLVEDDVSLLILRGLDFPLSGKREASVAGSVEVEIVEAQDLQGLPAGGLHVLGVMFLILLVTKISCLATPDALIP